MANRLSGGNSQSAKKMKKKINEFFKENIHIFVFAVLVAAAAGWFSWQRTSNYGVSLTFFVNKLGSQQISEYKYDSYYALKAVDEFGETFAAWFKNPEMVRQIFQKAEQPLSLSNLDKYSRVFQVKREAANLVEVRFGAASEEQAKKIAQALDEVAQEKLNAIFVASWQGIAFTASHGEAIIIKNTAIIWQTIIAGLILGLVVGFFFKYAKQYFRN